MFCNVRPLKKDGGLKVCSRGSTSHWTALWSSRNSPGAPSKSQGFLKNTMVIFSGNQSHGNMPGLHMAHLHMIGWCTMFPYVSNVVHYMIIYICFLFRPLRLDDAQPKWRIHLQVCDKPAASVHLVYWPYPFFWSLSINKQQKSSNYARAVWSNQGVVKRASCWWPMVDASTSLVLLERDIRFTFHEGHDGF